jgi:hypothetical protein
VEYDESYFRRPDTGEKYMLHVKNNGLGDDNILLDVDIQPGIQYTVSYKYKLISGAMNDAGAYLALMGGDGQTPWGKMNVNKAYRNGYASDNVKDFTLVKNDGVNIEYTFTLSADEVDSSNNYKIGFYFLPNNDGKNAEFYVGNFTVYATSDAEKKNLLANEASAPNMIGWHSNWRSAANGSSSFTYTASSGASFTAEYVPYDSSYFELPEQEGRYMLHVKNSGIGDDIIVLDVDIEPGIEYTVSYNYKVVKGALNNVGAYLALMGGDGQSPWGKMNVNKTYRNGYTSDNISDFTLVKNDGINIEYTFTLSADEVDDSNNYKIGFYFLPNNDGKNAEFYIGDFTVYATSDPNKTNLLTNKATKKNMIGWHSFWRSAEDKSTVFTVYNSDKSANFFGEYVEYDESYFRRPDTGEKYMLYVKNNGAGDEVILLDAYITPGIEYTVSYKYKAVKGALNDTGAYLVLMGGDGQTQWGKMNVSKAYRNYLLVDNIKDFKLVKNDGVNAEFTFTLSPDEVDSSNNYKIGFYFLPNTLGMNAEFYIADFTCYATNDPNKNNVLANNGTSKNMKGWHSNWRSADDGVTVFSPGKYTAEYLPYDETLFVKEQNPIDDLPKQMLFYQNGAGWGSLLQRFPAQIGKTYYFEISLSTTAGVVIIGTTDGDRHNFITNPTVVEKTEYENYYHAKYEITIPETARNGAPMTPLVFFGINIPSGGSGYVFDVSVYEKGDPNKTELLANPDFKVGLDYWAFGWSVWFLPGREELGQREWSNGSSMLKLMDFDEKALIKYVDDSRFNDGVWWKSEDAVEVEKPGEVTVKGTLVDQYGKPISGAKLVLEGTKKTYNTVTSSQGTFSFNKIPADFYELFIINSSGEKRPTGYYSSLFDGDIVTVKLVCDSSGNTSIDTPLPDDNTENEETDNQDNDSPQTGDNDTELPKSAGILNGRVYTKELKTVPNIKIFLRGVGSAVTDNDGYFEFKNVPVGEYDIYTVDENGNEYVFRKVSIKNNVELSVKLLYDNAEQTESDNNSNGWIWIVFAAAGVIIIVCGITLVIVFRRKKLADSSSN